MLAALPGQKRAVVLSCWLLVVSEHCALLERWSCAQSDQMDLLAPRWKPRTGQEWMPRRRTCRTLAVVASGTRWQRSIKLVIPCGTGSDELSQPGVSILVPGLSSLAFSQPTTTPDRTPAPSSQPLHPAGSEFGTTARPEDAAFWHRPSSSTSVLADGVLSVQASLTTRPRNSWHSPSTMASVPPSDYPSLAPYPHTQVFNTPPAAASVGGPSQNASPHPGNQSEPKVGACTQCRQRSRSNHLHWSFARDTDVPIPIMQRSSARVRTLPTTLARNASNTVSNASSNCIAGAVSSGARRTGASATRQTRMPNKMASNPTGLSPEESRSPRTAKGRRSSAQESAHSFFSSMRPWQRSAR